MQGPLNEEFFGLPVRKRDTKGLVKKIVVIWGLNPKVRRYSDFFAILKKARSHT